ncbi:MAG TPA: hypothetical protein ACFYEK_07085 [Candidatus Wunengus sp. YC60]|uniref:hypothetical protein n=1 Tax=Candidatus Wunengus sp. YC60 TaxID=3367697 RepID=UPI00402848EC
MWHTSQSSKGSSRQQIEIKEVTDGILVLPNHEYRLILETSSINFELKSDEEQDVLIDSFQNFLNALPSQIQILVRVREVDIDRYVEDIGKSILSEKEAVYKKQITNYCDFIKNLVSGSKILSRRFFIVIPYTNTERSQDMKLIKEHLNLSRDIVVTALEKLSMKARVLDTFEILDLFYTFYNSGSIKTQELKREAVKSLKENDYV